MKIDSIVIPQNNIDKTSSLLVDAHSLKALGLILLYERNQYDFSNLVKSPNQLYSSGNHFTWDNMLALANIIQNMVLYDTIIVDSLLFQADGFVRDTCELFPDVIKGVYFDYDFRYNIGQRVSSISSPILDRSLKPSKISEEHWLKILTLESNAKVLMDKMTHVVPDVIPPEYGGNRLLEAIVTQQAQDPLRNQNLPDCCVNSSATLARTHYYLELYSLPLRNRLLDLRLHQRSDGVIHLSRTRTACMIRVEFTKQMIEELKYERYHHPHPKVQQKMEVLSLKSQGLAHQDIRQLCNISKTTLTVYLRQYLEGGIERLKQLDDQGNRVS